MKSMMRTLLLGSVLLPGVSVAASAQQSAERQPSLVFWQSIGDTTLQRLVYEALRRNHDVRAADTRATGARAARQRSALDLTPTITATGGYTRQQMGSLAAPATVGSLPAQDIWDAGLRASWDVDVFGRGRRSLRGYRELVNASDEDVRDMQVRVASAVAATYFELRGAEDRLAVAERNAENQRGTLEITLQRLEGGRGTALDSERARALLSGTLAEIPALESAIAAARYRLGVLTARGADDLAPDLAYAPAPMVLPEIAVVKSVDSLVLRRPDIRRAERQVAASASFVGAAKAEYMPRVSLSAGAGYVGSRLDALGNRGTSRYVVGPIVSWPILDFARVKAGVDAARAAESEATTRYSQAVLRGRGEIETSLIAYRRARERLQHLEDAAAASERAAEIARLRYTEGASDFLQVLDAERTLLEAQDRLALGRTSAASALVAAHQALGGEVPLTGARLRY